MFISTQCWYNVIIPQLRWHTGCSSQRLGRKVFRAESTFGRLQRGVQNWENDYMHAVYLPLYMLNHSMAYEFIRYAWTPYAYANCYSNCLHLEDPDWIELDELPTLLAEACASRDSYAETASMAIKLCKPKGGRKAKACSLKCHIYMIRHHALKNTYIMHHRNFFLVLSVPNLPRFAGGTRRGRWVRGLLKCGSRGFMICAL